MTRHRPHRPTKKSVKWRGKILRKLRLIYFPNGSQSHFINQPHRLFCFHFIFSLSHRRYFATVLAIIYAIFLVIFGALVFVGDAVINNDENATLVLYPLAQVYTHLSSFYRELVASGICSALSAYDTSQFIMKYENCVFDDFRFKGFCIYMIVVALGYIIFLYMDIRIHVNRAKNAIRDREHRREILEEHINKLNVRRIGMIHMLCHAAVNHA